MTDLRAFDPWTASAAEAMRAHEGHDPSSGTPSPLVLHEAAQEVLRAREACLAVDGGCAVLASLSVCLLHGLQTPQWLSDAFIQRHAKVTTAEVGSWDEAFNRPWPPKTRLVEVRRRRQQTKAVHAAVWRELQQDPNAAVDAELFEKVSQSLNLGMVGATVRNRYYDALKEGMPNAIDIRNAMRNSANQP